MTWQRDSNWPLAAGRWPLAAGRWPLAAGRWLPCALIAAAIGVAPRDTLAQSTALYRIVHFPPQTTEDGAECRVLGLNDLGQAVGFTHELIGEDLVPRAFVWFPEDTTIDGVTYPTGMIHLLLEPGESLSNLLAHPSVARSINEATQIVGAWGEGLDSGTLGYGEAFLWIPQAGLPSGSPPTYWPARVMEPIFSSLTYPWSDAWDLSDPYEDAIEVVGARADSGCTAMTPGYRGFVWASSTRDDDDLPGFAALPNSIAVAISPTAASPTGLQQPTGFVLDHCFHSDPCGPIVRAVFGSVPSTGDLLAIGDRACAWSPAWTPNALALPAAAATPDAAYEPDMFALDVVFDGRMVGGGRSETDWQSEPEWEKWNCREVPLHWLTPTSTPDILPTPLDGSGVVDEGYANALNSSAQVVGTNNSVHRAYLWEQGAATWNDYDLNGLVNTDAADCDWDELIEAFDINEGVDGSAAWICGYGDYDDGNGLVDLHGFVLVPTAPCDADFDHDGDVDFSDLTTLTSAYGPCPGAYEICWPDLDADCKIGFSDLLILLSVWGDACAPEDSPAQGGGAAALFATWLSAGGFQLAADGDAAAIAWIESLGASPTLSQTLEGFALLSEQEVDQ